ncbi:MAG: hypothetical protein J4432_03395 [DPANN group archaeon]|nr:hypothetical protein [DPANN group archaeon]
MWKISYHTAEKGTLPQTLQDRINSTPALQLHPRSRAFIKDGQLDGFTILTIDGPGGAVREAFEMTGNDARVAAAQAQRDAENYRIKQEAVWHPELARRDRTERQLLLF